ncbi:copper oxidase [filamentous cyanobacterium CCP5]|nr:copper oxidase [filamentous cyanobacterium CCP5]
MQRRRFLTLSTVTVAGLLLSRCAVPQSTSPPPRILTSRSGLLKVNLKAELKQVFVAGKQATLMTYNGQVPGPILETRPGDDVEIRFTNGLSQPTNLHFHGLHISPSSNGDNPFLEVLPEEGFTYRFSIPADHPGGLYWYHPHYHGKVAEQVFGGLAGVIIVRGTVDEIPAIANATEEILVLQDFDLDLRGRLKPPSPVFRKWGRQGDLIAINGKTPARLTVVPGGLLRLRLLNASASRFYRLQLENHPWYLIALDGHALEAPQEMPELLLAPGERAELLIPGSSPGEYRLMNLPYDRGIQAMVNSMEPSGTADGDSQEPVRIATLTYGDGTEGEAMVLGAGTLPEMLLPIETLPEPDRVREFVFDHGIDAETGQPFLINGKSFKHHRVDTQVSLDTVEDWVLINKAGMDHPFHLHTNPFQVISRNDQPEPFKAWKDVVNIRAYETVRIRIPFRDYDGQTVYHCHILDHEDQGMMGIIEMV